MYSKAEHQVTVMVAWTEYERGVGINTFLFCFRQWISSTRKVGVNRKYIKTVADVL